ncbi:unnamed protein product [Mesocestoides corti]|uniref:Uncharacterized protein n=1 Tax=Mesocestoides corti TaxID=53468 RepID=A0A0R3U117_MESCO|nr:unnamed protein product [Mesocestoides corti]
MAGTDTETTTPNVKGGSGRILRPNAALVTSHSSRDQHLVHTTDLGPDHRIMQGDTVEPRRNQYLFTVLSSGLLTRR